MTDSLPVALVDALVRGPSLVTEVRWHPEVTSTMAVAAEAVSQGAGPGLVVLADVQTAGRGRRGRTWSAPVGTSLLASWVLPVADAVDLVPLVAGLALADVVAGFVPDHEVGLKWPNDVLVDGAKTAGILAERMADVVVLGTGVNVDWRGVERPDELAATTSLAEVAGADIDRWRVLAALAGVLSNRLGDLAAAPAEVVVAYRSRCVTIGSAVRVDLPGGRVVAGTASAVDGQGRLVVSSPEGTEVLSAGDVTHVR